MTTPAQRVATARSYIGKGGTYSGMCEKFVRTCFGFGAKYGSARLAYNASKAAGGFHAGDYNAPAGVPVFWDILSGKNVSFDHVAISVGGGYCISTSAGPGGRVALVSILSLTQRWGMTYRGWGEVYHGVRVHDAPKAPPVIITPPKSSGVPMPSTGVISSRLTAMGYSRHPQTIAYQRAQKCPLGLAADDIYGPTTEVHRLETINLQRALNGWAGPDLRVDGDYGAATRARVIDVKRRNSGGAWKGAIDASLPAAFLQMLGLDAGAHNHIY